MGKGSNVQKAQAARERNQKKMGKTDEGTDLTGYKYVMKLFVLFCCSARIEVDVPHSIYIFSIDLSLI